MRKKQVNSSDITTAERVRSDLKVLAGEFDREAMFDYIGQIRSVLDGAERFLLDGHPQSSSPAPVVPTAPRQTRTRRTIQSAQTRSTEVAQPAGRVQTTTSEATEVAIAEGD